MKHRFYFGAAALACLFASVTIQANPTIDAHCQGEWPSDREMKAYCVGEQSKALRSLQSFSGPIRDRCAAEWGTDYGMTLYCVKQQGGAQNRVASAPQDAIATYCANEWPSDYEMREYCQNNQRAARDRLEGNHSARRRQCDREWGQDYEMVEYCVEQGG